MRDFAIGCRFITFIVGVLIVAQFSIIAAVIFGVILAIILIQSQIMMDQSADRFMKHMPHVGHQKWPPDYPWPKNLEKYNIGVIGYTLDRSGSGARIKPYNEEDHSWITKRQYYRFCELKLKGERRTNQEGEEYLWFLQTYQHYTGPISSQLEKDCRDNKRYR